MSPRPRTGETPIRHVRLPDDVWERVTALADRTDRTRTQVVAEAIDRYLAIEERKKPK